MNVLCLIVAGVVRATLPGPDFTLAWNHSVAKTRWEETYRIAGEMLLLAEARVEGSGAGMEAPPDARLRDGRWAWQPQTTHAELRLTLSTFARDYTLCANGGCADLRDRVGATSEGEIVIVRACADSAPVATSAGSEQVRR